jgi:PilZ domain
MEEQTEKRSCERHYQEMPITVACFNTNRYRSAKMLNYSEGGIYFESNFAFQPRTSIYIRIEKKMTDLSECKFHNGFRSVALGEVKWCREISEGESGKYGIGIKYYEHEY